MTHLWRYRARAGKIVDGDTLDLVVDLGFGVEYKVRVRLARVNAYELRSSDEATRAKALEAKALAEATLWPEPDVAAPIPAEVLIAMGDRPAPAPGWQLLVRTVRAKDAYGRYLAHVEFWKDGWQDFGELLLSRGLAVPYGKEN